MGVSSGPRREHSEAAQEGPGHLSDWGSLKMSDDE